MVNFTDIVIILTVLTFINLPISRLRNYIDKVKTSWIGFRGEMKDLTLELSIELDEKIITVVENHNTKIQNDETSLDLPIYKVVDQDMRGLYRLLSEYSDTGTLVDTNKDILTTRNRQLLWLMVIYDITLSPLFFSLLFIDDITILVTWPYWLMITMFIFLLSYLVPILVFIANEVKGIEDLKAKWEKKKHKTDLYRFG